MTDPAQPSAVVIGYGNSLRGDDGLGWMVADLLADGRPAWPGVEVIRTHQLTPELAHTVAHCTLAVFVDAACDLAPGQVAVRRVLPAAPRGGSLGHHFDPPQLLHYAHALYGQCAESWTISAGGAEWGCCERLSASLRKALPRVLHKIDMLLAARVPRQAAAEIGSR